MGKPRNSPVLNEKEVKKLLDDAGIDGGLVWEIIRSGGFRIERRKLRYKKEGW